MTISELQAGARSYVTEIWCPPTDNGVHALHSHMSEPEPLPEPEPEAEMARPVNLDYGARIEAEIAAEQAEELRREDEAYAEYLATLAAEGLEPASPEQIAAENELAAIAGQMEQDRLDRQAEADLGHEYEGPEAQPGTAEYEATYAEYLQWAATDAPEPDARREAELELELEP